MGMTESPQWTRNPQSYIENWGTTHPFRITDLPLLFDSNGRPVEEIEVMIDSKGEPIKEMDYFNPANVPLDIKKVVFPGCRKGKEAKHSAYKALIPDFEVSLDIISVLRSSIHPYNNSKPTIEELAQVTGAGSMLPYWYVLKADNPLKNGNIPPYIASVSKVCKGLNQPINNVMIMKVRDRYNNEKTQMNTSFMKNPEDFYKYVDKSEGLLSEDGTRACPASPDVIMKGAEVLLEKPSKGMSDAEAQMGLSKEELKRIKEFGVAMFSVFNEIDLFKRLKVRTGPVERLYYESQGISSPLHSKTTGSHFRKQANLVLRNVNSAQDSINRALGRRYAPRLDVSDLFGPTFL